MSKADIVENIKNTEGDAKVSRLDIGQSDSSAMLLSTFLLLFLLTLGAQASSVKEYQDEVPGHEGECLGKDKKTFFKLGETMTTDQEPCTRKVCRGSAQPGSVYSEVQTCSKVEKQPGCQLKADAGKSFPDCCARLECPRN